MYMGHWSSLLDLIATATFLEILISIFLNFHFFNFFEFALFLPILDFLISSFLFFSFLSFALSHFSFRFIWLPFLTLAKILLFPIGLYYACTLCLRLGIANCCDSSSFSKCSNWTIDYKTFILLCFPCHCYHSY
jgi:hypothetical protein